MSVDVFDSKSEIRKTQERLIHAVYHQLMIIASLALVMGVYNSYQMGLYWTLPFYFLIYIVYLFMTLWSRGPYLLKVWILIGIALTLAVLVLLEAGIATIPSVYLLTAVFLSVVFLKRFWIRLVIFVSLAIYVGFAIAYSTGLLVNSETVLVSMNSFDSWLISIIMFLIFIMILTSSRTSMTPALIRLILRQEKGFNERVVECRQLEQEAFERNARLEVALENYNKENERKKSLELEKEEIQNQLNISIKEIRHLKDLIPICSYCMQERYDAEYKKKLKMYISQKISKPDMESICPGCIEKLDFLDQE